MAVPITPSAALSDFDGRKYHQFVPFNLFLAAPHLHGVLAHVTDKKFITGVVVTGDNYSLGSLSPAIIIADVVVTGDNLSQVNNTGNHCNRRCH
jgi:hypothetical protein